MIETEAQRNAGWGPRFVSVGSLGAPMILAGLGLVWPTAAAYALIVWFSISCGSIFRPLRALGFRSAAGAIVGAAASLVALALIAPRVVVAETPDDRAAGPAPAAGGGVTDAEGVARVLDARLEEERREAARQEKKRAAGAGRTAEKPRRLYSDFDCAEVPGGRPKAQAQQAIRDRLKNPAGARFSPVRETTERETGRCRFVVAGWVDATNGFGGVIRTPYAVQMRYLPGSDYWIIDGVVME